MLDFFDFYYPAFCFNILFSAEKFFRMKILIVKLSSIGDIIHTLPAFAAIRRALPDAEISWVAEKRSAEILRGNELLKNLIEVDTRALRGGKVIGEILPAFGSQIKSLRVSDFDIAIDFQGLLKSAAIAKLSKAKRRFGFDKENLREPLSRLFLTDAIKVEKNINIIKKNLALASKSLNIVNIEVPTENPEFPIFTGAEHKKEADEIVEKTNGDFAILNPAGGWVTKLWRAEKFGELADRLWTEKGIFSVVTTAPNEHHLAERVLAANKTGGIAHASPSLKGFYELAKRAKIYVGGDTGPTHLAVAANAPIVGIYGPTEWKRNGSPHSADICVERRDLACRVNCYRRKIGSWKKGECGNWICMDIPVEAVFDAILNRLKSEQSSS